jgi:hypothetical protein
VTIGVSDKSPSLDELPEHLGIYVYGVVQDAPDRVPDGLTGIDDAPVQLVGHGPLAAAVGVITLDRPSGRRADLMAHSSVLDTLAEGGPVVPVQFGSVLLAAGSVVDDLLAPEEERFTQLLEDLAGRHQFNLRATYNEAAVLAEVVADNREIAVLRERTRDLPDDLAHPDRIRLGELVARAMEGKREADTEVVMDPVVPHVASWRFRSGGGVDHLLDVAFLVDDEQRDAFEDALETVAEAMHERARLQLMGPLAPYDFVEG